MYRNKEIENRRIPHKNTLANFRLGIQQELFIKVNEQQIFDRKIMNIDKYYLLQCFLFIRVKSHIDMYSFIVHIDQYRFPSIFQ